MSKCSGMFCCICEDHVPEAEHIIIDENGDIIVMCDKCYNKAKQFFDGGKKDGKSR